MCKKKRGKKKGESKKETNRNTHRPLFLRVTALFCSTFLPSCGLIRNCMACSTVSNIQVHAKRRMADPVFC